jgi:hypothetical protein
VKFNLVGINMAKTNYTKVEEALDQGLKRMAVERLLEESKTPNNQQLRNPGIAYPEEIEKHIDPQILKAQKELMSSLKRNLEVLSKLDKSIFEKLGCKRSEIKHLMDNIENMTLEDWEKMKKIHEKIKSLKEELKKIQEDEHVINQNRVKETKKRFNVKKDWLPLQ